MKIATKIIAAHALFIWATAAFAQNYAVPPPQDVLQLSASGQVEVQQDLLRISLTTSREGPDANAVQTQLKAALETALAEARKAAQPQLVDVRTGNFSLYPRYGRDSKMSGWSGTAEMVLEGRDFARITQTAGRIQTMTLGGVSFALSPEQRSKVEGEAQAIAIERYKAKASELAKGFGFRGYSLREIAVNSNDQGPMPRQRMMAMEAKSASADSAVPVEAGKSTVVVTVSGTVQLR